MSAIYNKIERIASNYHNFLTQDNILSLGSSVGFLVIALIWEKFADAYLLTIHGVVADDLILSYLPSINVTFIVVQGALVITLLIGLLFLYEPKYLNFGIKSVALFILTRSFFISLTHLGAYPNHLVFDAQTYGFRLYNFLFNASNDFFFSGHTGLPYLIALVFWPRRNWRYFFIFASFVFGVSVLLAHVHYSIDVFAAPFITYSVFCLARVIFAKDYVVSRHAQ